MPAATVRRDKAAGWRRRAPSPALRRSTSRLSAGHSFTTPAGPNIMRSIFWASAVSAMRWMPVGWPVIGIAHQREQARMPGAGAERAMRMEAQRARRCRPAERRDRCRERRRDSAPPACRRSAWRRSTISARASCARRHRSCARRSRNDRAVPVLDHMQRLGVFQALDLHQPVDVIAIGAAAEAIDSDPDRSACSASSRREAGTGSCGWAAPARRSGRRDQSPSSSSGGGVRGGGVSAGAAA